MTEWTIQKLLSWITDYFTDKAIESPRLMAELLISHVLGLKRIDLYVQFERIVEKQQLEQLHGLVKRAGNNEPIQYLAGKTEFYSMEFSIRKGCLIPRPETELLVERAIEFLRAKGGDRLVCDLCTGSGCIGIAIAHNYKQAKVIATDICEDALKIAAENIEKYKLQQQVHLLCGDLFEAIVEPLDSGQFDMIVCNPPYVSDIEYEQLEANVKEYEPSKALRAGVDGLDVYRRIISDVDQFLKPAGQLMLEIGYKQGDAVRRMLEESQIFTNIKIEKDFHDNDRIVSAEKRV
jgi:release factor glutamine methyltransferase